MRSIVRANKVFQWHSRMCENAPKFRGLLDLPRLVIRAAMLRLLISVFSRLAAPCLPFTKNAFLVEYFSREVFIRNDCGNF